jgi:hypothetical protein
MKRPVQHGGRKPGEKRAGRGEYPGRDFHVSTALVTGRCEGLCPPEPPRRAGTHERRGPEIPVFSRPRRALPGPVPSTPGSRRRASPRAPSSARSAGSNASERVSQRPPSPIGSGTAGHSLRVRSGFVTTVARRGKDLDSITGAGALGADGVESFPHPAPWPRAVAITKAKVTPVLTGMAESSWVHHMAPYERRPTQAWRRPSIVISLLTVVAPNGTRLSRGRTPDPDIVVRVGGP